MVLCSTTSEKSCSRCGISIETKYHIGKCTEITSSNLFTENLETFEKWMDKMETPTKLKIHILTRITSWRMNLPWNLGVEFSIPSPILSQLSLGPWTHFMEGRLHIEWRNYMQQHYESTKSRRTGEQWTSQCIQRIWKLFHIDQWHIRNKFVHNMTEATKSTRKRENLQYAIKMAYDSVKMEDLLVKDQSLYDSSLVTIQSYSDDAMISWLKDHSLAIRDRDDAFQSSSTPTRTLRTWLRPKRRLCSSISDDEHKRQKIYDNSDKWNVNGSKTDLLKGSWKPP